MKFEMKKRILALALAGTTAFSVFGAAVSANAASTHVVYGNDPYTSYKAATVTFNKDKAYNYKNTKTGHTVTSLDDLYENLDALISDQTAGKVNENNQAWNAAQDALGYTWLNDDNTVVYKHEIKPEGFDYPTETYYSLNNVKLNNDDHITNTTVGAVKAETEMNTQYVYTNSKDNYTLYAGKLYTYEDIASSVKEKMLATDNVVNAIKTYYVKNTDGSVVVNPQYRYKYTNAYGEGKLVTDELSREGTTVENGNVYAYDYFSTDAGVASFADAWNAANFVKNSSYTTLTSKGNTDNLINALNSIDQADAKGTIDAEDAISGNGGYYTARASVVDEYEDFLVEIGLAEYNNRGALVWSKVTESEFLSAYSYKYNNNDEYNFVGLVDDLYKSIYNGTEMDTFMHLSSSNLVYLMQQYDKYVDGSYIDNNEVSEDKWAQLLIECLNAVDADDFTTTAAYNSYNKVAKNAIAGYEEATTAAKQEKAIGDLYNAVVVNTYGRSKGSDKADLVSTLDGLYFNAKSIPSTYLAARGYNSPYADLTLYTYSGIELATATTKNVQTSVKAVYPLYPVADYATNGSTKAATYKGNEGSIGVATTDEYEWFWNVYQLATAVNAQAKNGSYQGIVDTVNSALKEATDALTPTTSPAGSTTLRLEEAVNKYDGKVESDYVAKYYNAYKEATDYAAAVEGNNQTKYAVEIMETTGAALGYQGTQTTVTKGMIANLKASISNGEKALKAIKDSDKYNAAQISALNKAIADAKSIVDDYNGTTKTKVNGNLSNGAGDKDNFVISDLTGAISAIDSAINYSNVVMGWSKNDAGKWQYGTDDGYLSNGWNKVGATWYYFNADGTAKQSEWFQENGKWYYFNANCGAAYNWCKVDGNWYYFNGDNAMRTGWLKKEGSWYYLASSGKMVTGWTQIDGKWYYFSKGENSLGQMLANTTVDGYKLDANGVWNK